MKPILYSSRETEFRSNGIGRLGDATECTVTEERNGVFELSMKYPVSGLHYKDLLAGNIILAKPSWTQNPQPFDIKSVTPSTDGMNAEVYAQHISYRLADVPVKPFQATGIVAALNGLVTNSMIPHNFDVWTDIDNTDTKFALHYPKSFRACLGGTEGSILQTFSGSGSMEFLWDVMTVKVYRHRGTRSGVSIRYGKNLTSLKQETSIENTYTGVIAYWANSETGDSINSEIQYVANHTNYAHERIYILDVSSNYGSNDNQPSVEQLNADAKAYIESHNIGKPTVNLEVSFVDLSQTEEYRDIAPLERVNLCDTVYVCFPELFVNAESKVIKTVWNVLKDRYDSIELGDSKSHISDTIEQTVKDAVAPEISGLPTKTYMEKALQDATNKLIGGASGHMVVGLNGNGEADQLFFMDTTDPKTAKNVLRLNVQGIGFSSSGFNGPFVTAWTLDSKFMADFIAAGTLRANLMKTGLLSDAKGMNYWNMDTGEFHLSNSAIIGDKDSTERIARKSDVTNAQNAAEQKAKELADNATSLAEAAQKEADKKIVTFYQASAPTSASLGDLWIDIDDGNSLHRWDGAKWVNVQDSKMQTALTAANTAKSTADEKISTFSQTNEPASTGLTVGDLWFNPNDNNHLKRWNGSAWVEARDGYINEAKKAAQDYSDQLAANYYTKTEIDASEGEIKMQATQAVNYTDERLVDYVNTTLFEQTTNSITTEVNKKVNNKDFGTKITQNANSVRIAWNNISKYIQFENAALNIYDSTADDHKLIAQYDCNGEHFYRDGYTVGKIGANRYNDASKHGLVFDLEKDGSFMTWSAIDPDNPDKYVMKWYYVQKGKDLDNVSTGGKLHAACAIDMHKNSLINAMLDNCGLGKNQKFTAYNNSTIDIYTSVDFHGYTPKNLGGISGTLEFIRITAMGSNGNATTWHTGDYLTFENGLLTKGSFA